MKMVKTKLCLHRCGAGEIHSRARHIARRREAMGAPPRKFAARTCISLAPQYIAKLETTILHERLNTPL